MRQTLTVILNSMLVSCLVVVLITGGFLAFFYTPDGGAVSYDGSYTPLHGVQMSEAYDSTLQISFDVRGGLLMRQSHHGFSQALLVLMALRAVAGLTARQVLAGVALLGLGTLTLVVGYALPDDLFSGTVMGRIPMPVWYSAHLLLALAVAAALAIVWRRTSAGRPKLWLVLAACLILVLLPIAEPFI
ncbi:hypothetical protein ACFHYQ_15235 [Sphaerimonospora cavernae]|uniref:Cytochrome bc1 complex cytochrome b subunit n=1 Tax=Sphaerimonospora cavernae TaxID=1740611 RepID=A0ABV6U5C6_9ACTN